jgi:hypothetical protein
VHMALWYSESGFYGLKFGKDRELDICNEHGVFSGLCFCDGYTLFVWEWMGQGTWDIWIGIAF